MGSMKRKQIDVWLRVEVGTRAPFVGLHIDPSMEALERMAGQAKSEIERHVDNVVSVYIEREYEENE